MPQSSTTTVPSPSVVIDPLDQEVDLFTDPLFNAELNARHFFTTNNEAELNRKLNDMARKQVAVERILKLKVREHYKSFLLANNEVAAVEQEMKDLTGLLDHISTYVADIRSNRDEDAKNHRTVGTGSDLSASLSASAPSAAAGGATSSRTAKLMRKLAATNSAAASAAALSASFNLLRKYGEIDTSSPAMAALPLEVRGAPHELQRLVCEQQHGEAVALVLNMRAYHRERLNATTTADASSVVANGGGSVLAALGVLMKKVEQSAAELANLLVAEMASALPASSSLWGPTELSTRLRLLVRLGRPDLAADGFLASQSALVARTVHAAAVSSPASSSSDGSSRSGGGARSSNGPRLAATTTSSSSSESMLHADTVRLCDAFAGALFMSCDTFLRFFSAQAADDPTIAAKLLLWTQQQMARFVGSLLFSNHFQMAFDARADRAVTALRKLSTLNPACSGNSTVPSNRSVPEGPLTLLSQSCLDIAFAAVARLDAVGVHGRATLTWLCLADVQRLLAAYAELLLKEAALEARQDSWAPVRVSVAALALALPHGAAPAGAAGDTAVSASFRWMLNALAHFLDEVWALLRAGPHRPFISSPSASALPPSTAYGRADLCEAEPSAVTCLLRLCVRYVSELEAVDRTGFTPAQQQCFAVTLRAVETSLLAGVSHAVEGFFFAEAPALLQYPPPAVLGALTARVRRLSAERDLAGKERDADKLLVLLATGHRVKSQQHKPVVGSSAAAEDKARPADFKDRAASSIVVEAKGEGLRPSAPRSVGEALSKENPFTAPLPLEEVQSLPIAARPQAKASTSPALTVTKQAVPSSRSSSPSSSALEKENPFAGPPPLHEVAMMAPAAAAQSKHRPAPAATDPAAAPTPPPPPPPPPLPSSLSSSSSALDKVNPFAGPPPLGEVPSSPGRPIGRLGAVHDAGAIVGVGPSPVRAPRVMLSRAQPSPVKSLRQAAAVAAAAHTVSPAHPSLSSSPAVHASALHKDNPFTATVSVSEEETGARPLLPKMPATLTPVSSLAPAVDVLEKSNPFTASTTDFEDDIHIGEDERPQLPTLDHVRGKRLGQREENKSSVDDPDYNPFSPNHLKL